MSRHLAAAIGVLCCGLALGACAEDPKLKVSSLEPEKGDIDGGTYVVIKGNRFTADGPRQAHVYFGGRLAGFGGYLTDGEMVVRTPAGKPNEKVDVLIVFEPGGEIRLKGAYTYVEKREQPRIDDLDTSGKKKSGGSTPAPKK
jgi:hypothetical protein